MKRIWRTIASLITMVTLCLNMPAHALETDEAEDYVYSLHEVTFAIPKDMQMIEEKNEILIFVDDQKSPTKTINVGYESTAGEDVDLEQEKYRDLLINEIVAQGGKDIKSNRIKIDGHNALEITFSQMDNEKNAYCRMIIVELDNALFVTVMITTDKSSISSFDQVKNTIRIGGVAAAESSSQTTSNSSSSNTDGHEAEIIPGNDSYVTSQHTTSSDAIDASLSKEVVLVDNDVLSFVVTDFTENDPDYRFVVNFFVKNKSKRSFEIYLGNGYLNDYMIGSYCEIDSNEIKSGERVEGKFLFYEDAENLIGDIYEVGFYFNVRDKEDAHLCVEDNFSILPYGEKAITQMENDFPSEAFVAEENDWFTMAFTGKTFVTNKESWSLGLPVYIENHTDKTIEIVFSESSTVNGNEIRPYLSPRTVSPGKKLNTYVYWKISELYDKGIKSIKDVTLDTKVFDNKYELITEGAISFEVIFENYIRDFV